MKKLTTLILILICWPYSSSAQDVGADPFSLIKPYVMKSLNYYEGLHKLDSLESHFCTDAISQAMYLQAKATMYSFNGITDSAIMAFDTQLYNGVMIEKPKDTFDFTQH